MISSWSWDVEKSDVGDQLSVSPAIELTLEEGKIGDLVWFHTENYVIANVEKQFFVFNHQGTRIQLEDTIDTHFDFNIKCIRGFQKSVWIICGQTRDVDFAE
jgi:hypothetical protein